MRASGSTSGIPHVRQRHDAGRLDGHWQRLRSLCRAVTAGVWLPLGAIWLLLWGLIFLSIVGLELFSQGTGVAVVRQNGMRPVQLSPCDETCIVP